jgi:hypothetical protein
VQQALVDKVLLVVLAHTAQQVLLVVVVVLRRLAAMEMDPQFQVTVVRVRQAA